MKKIAHSAIAAALLGAATITEPTNAYAAPSPSPWQFCLYGYCPPTWAAKGLLAGTLILGGEYNCRKNRSNSCTEETKKAGQNAIDYVRGKKNGFKAMERRAKKICGKWC